MALKIVEKFMMLNDCYKTGGRITVKGLMVHSTATPGIMAADWFSRWNKPKLSPAKCVHAFLDATECYQYLPWHWRGWHAGGKANDTHIGIEWCEPKDLYDKSYFARIWDNGVDLYAMLCKQYGLTEKNITAHYEGYKLGIASNHADPAHWWKLHGKTMDMFRVGVAKALKGQYKKGEREMLEKTQPTAPQGIGTLKVLEKTVIRDKPVYLGNITGNVKPGEAYIVHDYQTGWYNIGGWVSAEYVQFIPHNDTKITR